MSQDAPVVGQLTSAPAIGPVREHLAFLSSRTPEPAEGWAYASPMTLVLDLALPETTAPLNLAGYEPGEPKLCFWNAQQAAARHPELLYVEGWAQAMFLPVPHAWCVHRDTGAVIDPTWARLGHADQLTESPSYLGVAFETDFVAKVMAAAADDQVSLIHADWARGHRLLRTGLRLSHHDILGTVAADWADATVPAVGS